MSKPKILGADGAAALKQDTPQAPKVSMAWTICFHESGDVEIARTTTHQGETYDFQDEKGRINSPALAKIAFSSAADILDRHMLMSNIAGLSSIQTKRMVDALMNALTSASVAQSLTQRRI